MQHIQIRIGAISQIKSAICMKKVSMKNQRFFKFLFEQYHKRGLRYARGLV